MPRVEAYFFGKVDSKVQRTVDETVSAAKCNYQLYTNLWSSTAYTCTIKFVHICSWSLLLCIFVNKEQQVSHSLRNFRTSHQMVLKGWCYYGVEFHASVKCSQLCLYIKYKRTRKSFQCIYKGNISAAVYRSSHLCLITSLTWA